MAALLLYIPLTVLAFFAWRGLKFYRHYEEAQKIGLPILCSPVDPFDPLWLMTKDLLTPLFQRLPFGLGDWTNRAYVGWNFPDFYATHKRVGSDALTIVTPGELEVYIADPAAADDVLARQRKDFIKSPAMYDLLNMFGPNVNTVNGETWQRHRRITVPPFNERNSGLVWKEALRQSREVLESWEEAGTVRTTTSDTMTLALHVLTAAGFGVSYSFREAAFMKPVSGSGHTMTYRNALNSIIRNMVIVILLRLAQGIKLPKAVLPGRLKEMDRAVDEFKRYLSEMIARERANIASASETDASVDKSNLMSVLLRSSDQAKANAEKPMQKRDEETTPANAGGLSDEEVYGNLFIYNLAGHDTTANTISFAITLLAVYPQWQEWVGEEVDELVSGERVTDATEWDYEQCFPKLQRCLAVMFETLRLYGPVAAIPRYTGSSYQSLSIAGKTHAIPPNTNVYINLCALHTHPDHWAPDPLVWRPDRWILPTGELMTPEPGTFNPWAGGPRICPGKKFAQVEFVAVLAALMAQRRVEVVKEGTGETGEEARARVMGVVEDSRVEFTLKQRRPERVGLRWVRR